jgi:ribonuclease HII
MDLPKEVKFETQEEADLFLSSLGANNIAGLDEVGRGSFSGPVVVAIVHLHPNHGIEGIKDSKKLSARRREYLAEQIMEHSWWNIGVRSNTDIDKYNIREATFEAAVDAVFKQSIRSDVVPFDFVLCDGGIHIKDHLKKLGIGPTISVVKGDQWYECIGAASIVAKVYRDAQIRLAAIKKYGVTPIHRKSFGLCKTARERLDV